MPVMKKVLWVFVVFAAVYIALIPAGPAFGLSGQYILVVLIVFIAAASLVSAGLLKLGLVKPGPRISIWGRLALGNTLFALSVLAWEATEIVLGLSEAAETVLIILAIILFIGAIVAFIRDDDMIGHRNPAGEGE